MKTNLFILRLFAFSMAATLSAGLLSCKHDDDDHKPEPTLSVGNTNVSFLATGGTQSVKVTSNTTWNWDITGDHSFLTVTKVADQLNLVAQKNESTEEKRAEITVKTDDYAISQIINVKIAGAERILELSGLDAAFEKTDNTQQNAQELTIICNASWEISGKPEWLNISNLNGTGNMTIKVWPNSVNNSIIRKATIKVKSGDLEVVKEIVQNGISSAYAHPKDIVTLTESSVWGFDFSNDLHHVYFTLMREIYANGLTDIDIQQSILQDYDEEIWVRRTPQQFVEYGNYFSWYGLEINTKYVLISVAYDSKNEIGEINRRLITTKSDDVYNSPYIISDNVSVSYDVVDGQVIYRIESTKDSQYSAYAGRYYSWAIAGTTDFNTLYCTDAQIAFLISQEIQKNPLPHDTYVNGTDRSMVRERLEGPVESANYILPANYLNDKYLQVVHWCMLTNGDFSGKISWDWFDLQDQSSSRRIISHNRSNDSTPKVIQFDPDKLRQNYKIIKLH